MASIKVKFRPSSVGDREGTICYQIIHDRRSRLLASEHRIFPDEWNGKRQTVCVSKNSERMALLLSIRRRIGRDVERLGKIVRELEDKGMPYAANDVVESYMAYTKECSLYSYMEGVIAKLKQNGKERTSETYQSALNSFRRFRAGQDIMLDCLDADVMEAYESWHRQQGNTANTISFYTRILRAVYNRAVADGIITDKAPFRRVYTGIDKTVKRALPLSAIKEIKQMDLSMSPRLDYAHDMFMMSFFLRGMSFVDMAFLRKSDLRNGHITYRRRKTGQQLTIGWTQEMQSILDKYPENASQYLLPIIKKPGINERVCYRNAAYNINRSLKQIADMLNLKIQLTMYVARHSWASAAKAKGVPIAVIKEGLGHDSEATTQIYLTSLDSSIVDQANSLIINSL